MSDDVWTRRLALSGLGVALLLVAGTASGAPAATSQTPLVPRAEPVLSASITSASTTSTQRSRSRPRSSLPSRPRPVRQVAVPDIPRTNAALTAQRRDRDTVPVRLDVAGVGISLPVVPVGVTRKRAMELPGSVRTVGWYRFGPTPADKSGVTVLAAHVDTVQEGTGPFAKLRWVPRGTLIAVTDGGGHVHRFRVTHVDSVAKTKVTPGEVFQRSGPARLALITCGGAYDSDSGYRDNVIVTAEPES